MSFTFIGRASRLVVDDIGVAISLNPAASQCRVYNSGANDCRIDYTGAVIDSGSTNLSHTMPAGLIEVHQKDNAPAIFAKCAAGMSTVLELSVGSGD